MKTSCAAKWTPVSLDVIMPINSADKTMPEQSRPCSQEIFFHSIDDRVVATGESGRPCPAPPSPPPRHTSISKPNKVQKFQFQTSGILLFTDVQKLYGPEISEFLPYMLQFWGNLWWLFTFSN